MAGPVLPDIQTLITAGIDPKTRLPIKVAGAFKRELKNAVKMQLRVKEENEFVNRFVWNNLPNNITSQELERLLYYRGQLCFFYSKELDEFYFMPYALDGTIDFYGRFNRVHPVPFASGTESKEGKSQTELLSAIKLNVIYTELDNKLKAPMDVDKVCVLLRDYTNQMSQIIIPRQQLNDGILDTMSECIPFMRTRLLIGTGVKAVRVNDADQAMAVADGSRALEEAALTGNPIVPVIGTLDFQELADKSAGTSEEYMLAYQSLDNFRKETLGIPSTGVYEKKAHILGSEQEANCSSSDLVLQDALEQRQKFCELVNKLYGLNISVDMPEAMTQPVMEEDMTSDTEDEEGEQEA